MEKISIIIPSYNHEKYIEECLNSALNQTFNNFELIITDDCSSDNTSIKIAQYNDPRIKVFSHAKNMGGAYAANTCLRYATGDYIAMLSSDDCWHSDKLMKQINFLKNNPNVDILFTKAEIIDENSRSYSDESHMYCHVFEQENRSREKWLNYFFYKGNCLCHPSALLKKNIYETIGFYNPCLALQPDYEFWIRASMHFNIHILDEKLVRFRVRDNESNASGINPRNYIRGRFEHLQTLNHFLKINSPEMLLNVFPEANKYGAPLKETTPYFLARIAIDTNIDIYQLWGMQVIFKLLSEKPEIEDLLPQFNFSDLHHLTSSLDVFKLYPEKLQSSTKNDGEKEKSFAKRLINKLFKH